jgi:hypothetical protein
VNHLHADVQACYETLKESDFGFVHQILTFIRRHDDSVTSTVAAPVNRFIVDNLHHLVKYGPTFLDKREYSRHYKFKIKEYYRFLAKSVFQLRKVEFWRFHSNALSKIGLRLRISMLLYSVIGKILKQPVSTGKLILNTVFKPNA